MGPMYLAKSGDTLASLVFGQHPIFWEVCDSKADPLRYMLMFHTWASALHSERMFQTYLYFLLITKKRNIHISKES
jgi:hypothetical protein